jgi:hypothetical protein
MEKQYRCQLCENTIPEARLKQSASGSKGQVSLYFPVICENFEGHDFAAEMTLEKVEKEKQE